MGWALIGWSGVLTLPKNLKNDSSGKGGGGGGGVGWLGAISIKREGGAGG